jgi:hypothetical protein
MKIVFLKVHCKVILHGCNKFEDSMMKRLGAKEIFKKHMQTEKGKLGNMGDSWLYCKIGLLLCKEQSNKWDTVCSGTPCIYIIL